MSNQESKLEIVKNGEINISADVWTQMNAIYSKDQIKKIISDAIADNEVPMPLRECAMDECINSFCELQQLDTTKLIKTGTIGTRYHGSWEGKYIDASNVGNKASDFFHQYNRWLVGSINSPSPYRTWTIEKFRLTLLNCLWTLKFTQIGTKELRSAIALRKYIASQFRPSAAKAIYEHFNAKNVLDFSSGWGDRLCAFHACENTESYVGIDPNARLFKDYAAQSSLYNTGKTVTMINNCAENVDLTDHEFDLIFTSPPYFTVERYTDEPNQSWKKFKKIDLWREGFLFPVLDKAWKQLKVGGHLVINISDVYAGHKINEICNPMVEHMTKHADCKQLETMGIRFAKRPQSKADQCDNAVFCEPVWIWEKI